MKFEDAINKFVLLHKSEDWNIETTMIYVHMNKNQLKKVYDENIKNSRMYSGAEV